MKKSKLTRNKTMTDACIDQYCQSVEELLSNINEKEGSRPRLTSQDESDVMDYSEDSYMYT